MTTLYASLRLRPTRIGFLVRPGDLAAVRRIMRLCCCLWGGSFNPIIPVSHRVPRAWREAAVGRMSGAQLSSGYIRFFEPDVYVEASPGLATIAGLTRSETNRLERRIVPLDDLVSTEDGRRPEFLFGLDVFELYRDLYKRQYRFVPREEQRIALFAGQSRQLAFTEAVFGGFPADEQLSHIVDGFVDAFEPTPLRPTAEDWFKVLRNGYGSPLSFTRYSLNADYWWSTDPTLFVVDPTSPLDLIDFWNVRQFKRNVLAINLDWIPETSSFLQEVVERNFRPLPGNPHGVMVRTTMEFARSISEQKARSICESVLADAPKGSWLLKPWYDPIWHDHQDDFTVQPKRALVSATRSNLELPVASDDKNSVRFRSISPEFAERFGGSEARWVNVLEVRDYGQREGLALVLPSHVNDPHRSHIRLGAQPLISSREGLVLLQHWKDHGEYLTFQTGRDAISGWLERQGIQSTPSDAGRISDQLLASVDGFWRAHILSNPETLQLLDKMSKSVRTTARRTLEEYPDRTAPVEEWRRMLARRASRHELPAVTLDDFVRAGALRLGISLRCPNCDRQNWYGLSGLATRVSCSLCLREYDFPQGSLPFRNTPWHFRLAGPYTVPNFAGGAYATVLALRTFAMNLGMNDNAITYSTNLNLDFDGKPAEVDFAFWYRREWLDSVRDEPVFAIGEAKSFAEEAIHREDVTRLRVIASKLPGSFLVFAVLKDALSEAEKNRVARLALWGRTPLPDGRPRAPVIVLTGTEVFADQSVTDAWKQKGGRHAQLASHASIRLDNLRTLSDLTQQLYLGLPSYGSWLEQRRRQKSRRRSSHGS